jgi:hypothetical protein
MCLFFLRLKKKNAMNSDEFKAKKRVVCRKLCKDNLQNTFFYLYPDFTVGFGIASTAHRIGGNTSIFKNVPLSGYTVGGETLPASKEKT